MKRVKKIVITLLVAAMLSANIGAIAKAIDPSPQYSSKPTQVKF